MKTPIQLTIFLSSLFFAFNADLRAQRISQVDGNKFLYLDKEYRYQEMGHIFIENRNANNLYLNSRSNLQTARTLGIVSLTTLGLGSIAVASDECDFLFDDCEIAVLGALAIVFVVPATGIAGLILNSSGVKKRRQSIDVFNKGQAALLPDDEPIEISLVINNGFGFLIRF